MNNPITDILLDWFAANQRPLPWRQSYDPYQVWISEVMLQQTQMERGVAYFLRWMDVFPDIAALARAHEDEVLKAWEGLGYYSRARNLLKAARMVVHDLGGRFPDSEEGLRALPGVGPYTARAVLSLAHGHDLAVVDANVERVLARLFDLDRPVREASSKRFLRDKAQELLPPGRAREFNQALMEFGALACSRSPRCDGCPLARHCEALRLGIVEHRPVLSARKEIIPLEVATGVLAREGRVFIQRRRPDDVWGGLWEFPGGIVDPGETDAQAIVREMREELDFTVRPVRKLAVIRHGYTRYRVTLHCWLCELDSGPAEPVLRAATAFRWETLGGLDNYAFPAGHRKLIDMLGAGIPFPEAAW